MLRLDIDKTFFAMAQFYYSYFQAAGDDSLGSLIGGIAIYRNDDIGELFNQGYADDWRKIYYSLGSEDHTVFEGFQAVNQFTNEYLPDVDIFTDLARNLVYATRIICEMSASERETHPVWQQWVTSCEWVSNPEVFKIEAVELFDDDVQAEVLPPARPIMDDGGGKKTIDEMQTYFIMMDFLKTYYAIAPDNRDLEKVIGEFILERKTQNQKNLWYSWKDYFDDVSKR
ncbi:hypothetical protein [Lactiplantibacillus fabifermentans]|uniref:Uncharacterized protein n=1 Tax=Lactiplantibacillus fabifermentans DSM 21115 TaxID=1413187 RepID=A0A0R2NYZ5_9LACO|nr:hypothetical protein [Lactiplantibacillus fabifermentans]KRO29536.1 hypothetical protein DY78_GL002927 [Lactiplantibacillus fabifermentans DSM 21115]